jgi:citronellol/citronellal dehydrogenase
MMSLANKTIFITGGSRGIGLEIAKKAAADGANIVIAAKTIDPHPTLPGTIYSAAEEIRAAGGSALPIQCDIRNEEEIAAAITATVKTFGGIDILINNASAINLTPTEKTPAKRFDLMFDVNVRGTFLTSQAAIPYLRESAESGRDPHILTLSPPLSMKAKWFKPHLAYTMAKYGMSMCVLGMAEEFKRDGIAVNALWPRTAIDTAALAMIPGVDTDFCRTPQILADSAYIILNRKSIECTGNFFVDEEVLASEGITDLEKYSVVPGTTEFLLDFFLD